MRDWQTETGDGKVPTVQTLEFLYETLADQRRERRLGQGVLLGTIHSVKGMEFGHVFILDGGWGGQDREEQRRLLYVALTRAKETLCLLQRGDVQNAFLQEIDGDFVLRRNASETPHFPASTQKQYAILGMQDFYLNYAARFPETAAVHRCLAKLQTGDRLDLLRDGDRIAVKQGALTIAMLSQHASVAWRGKLEDIETATVIALVRRYRDDGSEEYRDACRVGQWEVPLLEVVCRGGRVD
jgi:ATP-dependent DNA helicase RecQ